MTAQEFKALGLLFQDLADWLAKYPTEHDLDKDTLHGFEVAFGKVQKSADSLMNQAVEIAITDVGATVQKLQDATKKAAAAVKTVDMLTKGLASSAPWPAWERRFSTPRPAPSSAHWTPWARPFRKPPRLRPSSPARGTTPAPRIIVSLQDAAQ